MDGRGIGMERGGRRVGLESGWMRDGADGGGGIESRWVRGRHGEYMEKGWLWSVDGGVEGMESDGGEVGIETRCKRDGADGGVGIESR